jgi:phosphoglycolate phosphatase
LPKLTAGNKTIDCKLVVFDKDGTIIDYRSTDLELAKVRKKSVERVVGRETAELWGRIVGVDLKSEKIDYRGPLGTEPRRDEMLIAAAAFYLKGHSWDEARHLAQRAYDLADDAMKPPYGAVLLEDVAKTLGKLRANGLKLTVASTDTHKRTVECFRALGIASLFDAVVGPEDVVNGKPSPGMIFEILKQTCSRADECVMVGDSIADMRMGRSAKVKACIGVLTGITRLREFAKLADVVVDSAAQLDVLQNCCHDNTPS